MSCLPVGDDTILEEFLKQHPIVIRRLQEVGWSEGRRVDTSEFISFLRKLRLPVNPLARQAMENLAGLRLDLPEGGTSWLSFDPREAVFTTEYVSRVENIVNANDLTPIGAGGGYVVLVSAEGQAFLLQDEWLCLIGFDTIGDLLYFAFTGNQTVCHEFALDEST